MKESTGRSDTETVCERFKAKLLPCAYLGPETRQIA